MWPLGQPHKLWLVPNFSARGPPKNQCSASTQSAVFHGTASLSFSWLNHLPAWHSFAPSIQSHLEWPLHLFTHLSARAQGSLLLLSLTLTCKHVYIIIMNYYLVACICRIETDSASSFVCNWYIVCSVLCILQLCALEQLIK